MKPLAALVALLLAGPAVAAGQAPTPPPAPAAAAPTISLMGPGLAVSDLAAALHFYRDGLGLTVLFTMDGRDVRETILGFGPGHDGPMLFLLSSPTGAVVRLPPMPAAAAGKIVLAVSDAQAISDRLRTAGFAPGPLTNNPRAGVTNFWVSDPDGHRFEIVQRRGHDH